MKREKFLTRDAQETAAVAAKLARAVKGGEVFALVGGLGAGKTTFVQAFAKALGVKERVQSPTFILMHEHRLKKSGVSGQVSGVVHFVHADAYRADAAQFRNIGIEEYFDDPEAVTLIEWADRVEELLPKGAIRLHFTHKGGDKREIEIVRP